MDKFYFIVFNNTHGAMKAESYLKSKQVKIAIMPTPTQITMSCGISIIISEESLDEVRNIIIEGHIDIKGLYLKENSEYSKIL